MTWVSIYRPISRRNHCHSNIEHFTTNLMVTASRLGNWQITYVHLLIDQCTHLIVDWISCQKWPLLSSPYICASRFEHCKQKSKLVNLINSIILSSLQVEAHNQMRCVVGIKVKWNVTTSEWWIIVCHRKFLLFYSTHVFSNIKAWHHET